MRSKQRDDIQLDYKLENNYKVFGPFILQEKGQLWSSNKVWNGKYNTETSLMSMQGKSA